MFAELYRRNTNSDRKAAANSTFALCERKYKFFAYILPAAQKVVFLSKQKKRQHLCNKQTFRRLDKRVFQNSHKTKLQNVTNNAKTPVKTDNYTHLSFIRFSQNFKT